MRRIRMNDPEFKLTPEQEEIRKKMLEQEEEEERLWDEKNDREKAERLFSQVKFVLDNIHQHPFIQQILSARQMTDKEKYTRIALEALINNHPDMDPAEIAKRAGMIGKEIAKHLD